MTTDSVDDDSRNVSEIWYQPTVVTIKVFFVIINIIPFCVVRQILKNGALFSSKIVSKKHYVFKCISTITGKLFSHFTMDAD